MANFERMLKNVGRTDWPDVCDILRNGFLSYTDDEAGSPPEPDVCSLCESASSEFALAGSSVFAVIAGGNQLRTSLARESIYLAHKAGALFRSMDRDLSDGDISYPEVTAYNASFFLAKAICAIRGLWYTHQQINNKFWLIDAYSDVTRKKQTGEIRAYEVGGQQIGHQQTWALLQRAFVNPKHIPVDSEFIAMLKGHQPNEIARIRNHIQYRNTIWPHDDLLVHQKVPVDWISPFDKSTYSSTSIEEEEGHFYIYLYLWLMRAYCAMLENAIGKLPPIRLELTLIKENITNGTNILSADRWVDSFA